MPALNVSRQAEPLFEPGQGSVLLVNNDEVNTVYVGPQKQVSVADIAIPPQGSLTLDGAVQWWGSSVSSATIQVFIIPGGTQWDNPVGVAIALNDLGLATLAEQVNQNTAIPSNIQVMGAPPYIPGQLSASAVRMSPGGSPYTLATMAGPSRLWYASLSYGVATDSSYSGGGNDPVARIYIGNLSQTILLCQGVIASPGEAVHSDQALSFGGLPVARGATIFADVNGGSSISDVSQNASAVILYSTP